MGTHLPHGKGHSSPVLFSACLLWPNGWMDQDTTWYGGMSRPKQHCVRWGPSSLTQRGTAPSVFGQLLWPTSPQTIILPVTRIVHYAVRGGWLSRQSYRIIATHLVSRAVPVSAKRSDNYESPCSNGVDIGHL